MRTKVVLEAAPSLSDTEIVTCDLPAALGVPVRAPVRALRWIPAGSEPRAIVHRSGATPPRTCKCAE